MAWSLQFPTHRPCGLYLASWAYSLVSLASYWLAITLWPANPYSYSSYVILHRCTAPVTCGLAHCLPLHAHLHKESRVPQERVEFNKKTGQTVLVRQKAWTDRCTEKQLYTYVTNPFFLFFFPLFHTFSTSHTFSSNHHNVSPFLHLCFLRYITYSEFCTIPRCFSKINAIPPGSETLSLLPGEMFSSRWVMLDLWADATL